MNKVLRFFNFKFVISLALAITLILLIEDHNGANDRANRESARADRVIALLQDQQTKAAVERAKIDASQIDLLKRYTSLETANKALLEWLTDNHFVIPTRIQKLFIYVPVRSPKA